MYENVERLVVLKCCELRCPCKTERMAHLSRFRISVRVRASVQVRLRMAIWFSSRDQNSPIAGLWRGNAQTEGSARAVPPKYVRRGSSAGSDGRCCVDAGCRRRRRSTHGTMRGVWQGRSDRLAHMPAVSYDSSPCVHFRITCGRREDRHADDPAYKSDFSTHTSRLRAVCAVFDRCGLREKGA